MNSRGTPQWIGVCHPRDEADDVGVGLRSAHARRREVRPMVGELASLPAQNSGGGHDHEGLAPSAPHFREDDPKQAIAPPKPGPLDGSLVHRELLAQGDVFKRQLPVTAAEEGQEPQHVQERADHGTVIVAERRPKHQPFRDVRILTNDTARHLVRRGGVVAPPHLSPGACPSRSPIPADPAHATLQFARLRGGPGRHARCRARGVEEDEPCPTIDPSTSSSIVPFTA
jgi:hypothetical protein